MSNYLFTTAALALACVCPMLSTAESVPDSPASMLRNAGSKEMAEYMECPVILVSEYKTEFIPHPKANDVFITLHHCRIVDSQLKELPVNDTIVFAVPREGNYSPTEPRGKLSYILAPSIRHTSRLTNTHELHDGFITLDYGSNAKRIEFVKKLYHSRGK